MASENKYNFKVINFSSELPQFVEVRSKEWVMYGEKNDFPDYLIELLNTSAMHNTCVRAKIEATIGEGISSENPIVNSDGELLSDLIEKVAYDKVVFGGYALNILWSKDRESIAEVYHLPFSKVRSGKQDEENKVNNYFFSSNWNNTRKYKPLEYAAFSTTNNKGENANQIYYSFDYNPSADVYPVPDYIGALTDVSLDASISRFHDSNLKNGMHPSLLINFPAGEPEEREKQRLYDDLIDAYTNVENSGKVLLTFSDGPELAPQVQTITQQNDQYYIVVEERLTSRILSAHRISSPLLLGIRTSGGSSLGNNAEELEVSFSHFLSTTIESITKNLSKSLLKVFKFYKEPVDTIDFLPAKLDLIKNINDNGDTINQ